jgi:hypothetical protein
MRLWYQKRKYCPDKAKNPAVARLYVTLLFDDVTGALSVRIVVTPSEKTPEGDGVTNETYFTGA